MNNKEELPIGYVPFDKMIVCGNTLINSKVPVSVDNQPVFLIGKSEEPLIWLQAQKKKKGSWNFLIEKNVCKDPNIRLLKKANMISVYLVDHLLLYAFKDPDEILIITHIDLRPIGFSIFGDMEILKVGNQNISGNTFKNVHTMINVR